MKIAAKILSSILRFFLSFVFVLSFSSLIVAWILADFSQEENIKHLLTETFYQSLKKQWDAYEEEEIKNSVLGLCANKESIQMPLGDKVIRIYCKDLSASTDFSRFIAESAAKSFYEAEYNCQFIECLNEAKYDVLISKKGDEFYTKALTSLIITSAVSGLAFFTLEEGNISKRIRGVALLILLVCLPALSINFLIEPIKQRFISHSEMIDNIVENLLEIAFKKYLITFILGFSLLVASIFLWLIERAKKY